MRLVEKVPDEKGTVRVFATTGRDYLDLTRLAMSRSRPDGCDWGQIRKAITRRHLAFPEWPMDDNHKPRIFLCHAKEDKPWVRELYHRLKDDGYSPWLDEEDLLPGQSWWAEIKKVLSDPYNLVVVCLSCNSVTKRGVVQREIKRALDVLEEMPEDTIYLIPARMEDCQVPDGLSDLHWVDLFEPGGFEKLKGALDFEIDRRLAPKEAENKQTQHVWRQWPPMALAGLLVVVLVGLVAVWLSGSGGRLIGTARAPVVVAPPRTETPTITIAPQPASPAPTLGIGSTLVREKDGMVMVYVPGGTFQMGSPVGDSDEQPVHTVTLDSFWIDRTEVTNDQYERCAADGTCIRASQSSSSTRDSYYGDSQYNDYPAIRLDWNDAKTYCEWIGGRLPTEAEWEYAARGPEGHIYPWGNDPPDGTLANYGGRVGDTTKVGSYPDGESWVGALDMAGNVWEWVNDWYAGNYYAASQSKNPTGPSAGVLKVIRGGSWYYIPDIRPANRVPEGTYVREVNIGFRCAVASTSSP
jgi:formylglycine-generating enzyme required for sulfatase activity